MRFVRSTRLGAFALLLAFLFGMMPATAALAQESDSTGGDPVNEVLQNATDAGMRVFVYSEEDFGQPLGFSFVVAEFETEEEAIEAQEAIPAAIELEMLGEEGEATPEAEFAVVEEYDVADGGTAYHFAQTDSFFGTSSVTYVQVRDGTNLHFWVGLSFSMDAAVEPPNAFAILDPLVEEWFEDGSRAGDDILDRIPSTDDLPDGYDLEEELQGVEALILEEDEEF